MTSFSDGVVRTRDDIEHNENLDLEGNLPQSYNPRGNPWVNTSGWDKHTRTFWARKAAPEVRQRMRVERGDQWGAVRSHLADKYPECVERDWKKYVKSSKERKGMSDDD